jgi:thiosulfate/3-mercaptopyruvate sulfurtransferase
MNRIIFAALPAVLIFVFSLIVVPAIAGEVTYNYIASDDLKARLLSDESMTVLDIQVKEEFDRHHIRGAVATYAYPVKSGEEKARIASVYASLIDGSGSVIIVCPRGGGGAKRTCDYLVSRGIEAQRLLILENGQGGWPYPEMLEGAK